MHEVGRAGTFRPDREGCSAQISKGVKSVAPSREQQQGLRLGEPTKEFEPRISGHRRTILDEGEHLSAVPPTGGEAVDVLDRARSWHDRKRAVLALGPVSQTYGQRVILASRRPRQN